MFQLRNRLSYANVMSTIAVFLALGGATAVAASQLGKKTVGTKQLKANSVTAVKLKRNAVTETKVRDNAITTAKIKDGAVTGAKVQTATLGTVPSASTFSGYQRRGIVRVMASPAGVDFAASRAASPEVPLLSAGPFTVYGKCFDSATATNGVMYIKTRENGALFEGDSDDLEGDPPFLDVTTEEEEREIVEVSTSLNEANYEGADTDFGAMAPDGTVVRGAVQVASKNGIPPGGVNGIYGAGNACLFAGEMTALNG